MINIINHGGVVMYPLFICSVIVLAAITERTFFWIIITINRDKNLAIEVLELCRKGKLEKVQAKVKNSKDYIIKILISGILHKDFSISKAMESAASDEIKKMKRNMPVIDTMITVAPLLGIFGTVIGIILSFDAIGTTGIEHPKAVTAGIAQALLTTATGLGIAIFSVFPYNFFNSLIQNASIEIEKTATNLEIVFEKLEEKSESKS